MGDESVARRSQCDSAPGGLGIGKKTRLHRLLYGHGARNGTALLLPYDHGLEHGPRDFFANPTAADPAYVIRLAVEGNFNGIAMHIGNIRRFFWEFAGEVPLILKLNGKTNVPSDDEPLSALQATVSEAVAVGADAVGYTLYVGSPRQADDMDQLRGVREEAERLGMPLVIWAYPRGSAIDARGGRDSLYAVDYAARAAAELGADIVKLTWPDAHRREGVPSYYDRDFDPAEMMSRLVTSANGAKVVLSGGNLDDPSALLKRTNVALESGATGVIVGRNVWQRAREESLTVIADLHALLAKY